MAGHGTTFSYLINWPDTILHCVCVLDSTAGYLEVVNDLKRLIRASQKRVFTFVIGKLNVAKMANFAEVDVFILVASPENSLLDSKVR